MALDYNGDMRLKIGTKSVMHEVECSLSETTDFQEIASKDIEGTDYNPSTSTWSITANGFAANDGASTQADLKAIVDAYKAKLPVAIELTDGVTGNIAYSGSAYIESYSLKATNKEKVTFDYNLKGIGILAVNVTA